jgi:hypothetical protein
MPCVTTKTVYPQGKSSDTTERYTIKIKINASLFE